VSGQAEERIPDRLISGLVKAKSVNGAVEILKQICLSLFDLTIHTPDSHEMATEMDVSRLWNDTRDEIVGLDSSNDDSGGDGGAGQAGVPHLFRNYDAGYFAYPL